jgi:hypothetical protein
MTLGDALGLSDPQERFLTRTLQAILGGLIVYGLFTAQWGVALNGMFALAVTLLPALLRREYGYAMDSGLVLWITVALFLNALGLMGLYSRYQWYDEITHTVSATIIAGLGYAAFRAFEVHSDEIDVPSAFRSVFVVVFVLAAAVVWELLEFGSELLAEYVGGIAPLTVYGIDDIVTDMIFNAVGAVLVALWGGGYVGGVVSFFRERLRARDDG